jgi:sulfite exporter TauE/SafE
MDSTLALTALTMGLAGGPHCLGMCASACVALGGGGRPALAAVIRGPHQPAPSRAFDPQALAGFHLGRLLAYSAMGALAALSVQALGWLSIYTAALRPIWMLVHVAAAVLGWVLLWQARQPAWLDAGALGLARRVQGLVARRAPAWGPLAPLLVGLGWGLLPCGLLYSALLVAALSGGVLEGAAVMALFALGTGVSLLLGPWLWLRLRGASASRWAIRVAGGALLASSVWALWMGVMHDGAPWCVTSSLP